MIIGIDAATLDLVEPWVGEGRLPNLARFFEAGAVGRLRTTLPVVSPAAWSTFATGLNPGKHGVLEFYQLEAGSYEPRFVDARRRRGETFWSIAGRQGVRGGVINVPISFPPAPYNGFLVGGMLSPGLGRRMCHPHELLDDLLAASPRYMVDVDMLNAATTSPEEFLDQAIACTEARARAALALYRKHRPPLFCVVFVTVDRISHYFWSYFEAARDGRARGEAEERLGRAIPEIYAKVDEAVGALLAEAEDGTDVFIVSDHGSGPYAGGLDLRRALEQAGLLTEERLGAVTALKRRALLAFARTAPPWLKNSVKTLMPRLAGRAAGVVTLSGIDFGRSRAYPSGLSQGIFINVKGRQPTGVVEPGAEYESVRDDVIAALSELTDPATGRRVVHKVHRREEVWCGPCTERLPDLVVEQVDNLYNVQAFKDAPAGQAVFSLPAADPARLRHSAGHRRHGVLMALGPHVRPGRIEGAGIEDVPATVLALLGCRYPDEFDGRVLTELLTDDVKPPGTYGDASERSAAGDVFDEDDRAALEERLKGLGYM